MVDEVWVSMMGVCFRCLTDLMGVYDVFFYRCLTDSMGEWDESVCFYIQQHLEP